MIRFVCSAALALGAGDGVAQSGVKQELVQQILQRQQPGLDAMARTLVEQPAAQMMQAAGRALQTEVPADRREAAAKAIEADVKRFVDEATPLVRDRAIKAAPSTIGAMLDEKFSEDELKQLIAWFDSPVNKKYQQLNAEMQKGFVQKVVTDSGPVIDPKLRVLEQKVRASLGVPAARPAASSTQGSGKSPSGSTKAPGP